MANNCSASHHRVHQCGCLLSGSTPRWSLEIEYRTVKRIITVRRSMKQLSRQHKRLVQGVYLTG